MKWFITIFQNTWIEPKLMSFEGSISELKKRLKETAVFFTKDNKKLYGEPISIITGDYIETDNQYVIHIIFHDDTKEIKLDLIAKSEDALESLQSYDNNGYMIPDHDYIMNKSKISKIMK